LISLEVQPAGRLKAEEATGAGVEPGIAAAGVGPDEVLMPVDGEINASTVG
jgi:hypothetical protein